MQENNSICNTFPELIKLLLKDMTQEELADKIGISSKTVHRWIKEDAKLVTVKDGSKVLLYQYLKEQKEELYQVLCHIEQMEQKELSQELYCCSDSFPPGYLADYVGRGISIWFPTKESLQYIFLSEMSNDIRTNVYECTRIKDPLEQLSWLKEHEEKMQQAAKYGIGAEFWIKNVLYLQNHYPSGPFDMNSTLFVRMIDSYLKKETNEQYLQLFDLYKLVSFLRNNDDYICVGSKLHEQLYLNNPEAVVLQCLSLSKTYEQIINEFVSIETDENNHMYVKLTDTGKLFLAWCETNKMFTFQTA